ncbi:MAG: VOC family protein [Alphaproteobacteria bacterium]
MKPRINMITLGTRNLERATAFYAKGLGFPQMPCEGEGIAFFELQGAWLALYPWEFLAKDALVDAVGSGFRGFTLAHNVSDESQVVHLLKIAEAAGASISKPAQPTEWGGFSGYFQDLDGYLWEVAFNPFFWPGPGERKA